MSTLAGLVVCLSVVHPPRQRLARSATRLYHLLLAALVAYAAGAGSEAAGGQSLLDGEVRQLRRLAATGSLAALAQVLDSRMVQIPAGVFIMGDGAGPADEQPERLVYLDAYEIDRYEVTNVQYQRYLMATGRPAPPYWMGGEYPARQADYPVVGVSWNDADAYCAWAGKRLPTEAEWERACRGDDGQTYPWGHTWAPGWANVGSLPGAPSRAAWDAAWRRLQTGEAVPGLCPVGSYVAGASPFGVLDMAGNASEWVADWYNWAGYSDLPAENPRSTGPPWNHSLRGSAWFDPYGAASSADQSRCAARNSSHAVADPRVGFRCARSAPCYEAGGGWSCEPPAGCGVLPGGRGGLDEPANVLRLPRGGLGLPSLAYTRVPAAASDTWPVPAVVNGTCGEGSERRSITLSVWRR